MNKKFLKFSLVLCASILMAISCNKKETTNPELPSMGTLTTNPTAVFLSLTSNTISGKEKSSPITVQGFSDGFKSAAKEKTDITYKVKTAVVGGISGGAAAKTEEELKKVITSTTFNVEVQDTFDKIKVGFSGTEEEAKTAADAIAKAITKGKTGAVTLTVEAAPAGNTEGKYSSTTFEVRLGITVS